jgi:hypothetical protein
MAQTAGRAPGTGAVKRRNVDNTAGAAQLECAWQSAGGAYSLYRLCELQRLDKSGHSWRKQQTNRGTERYSFVTVA